MRWEASYYVFQKENGVCRLVPMKLSYFPPYNSKKKAIRFGFKEGGGVGYEDSHFLIGLFFILAGFQSEYLKSASLERFHKYMRVRQPTFWC